MKRKFIRFGLLAVMLLLGAQVHCPAQERSHFQGNIKATGLGIYWDSHYLADLSLGWRFNEKRYLGVGSGCHWVMPFARGPHGEIVDVGLIPAVPVFADYVRYFPFSRHPRSAFYLGLEAGAAWYLAALPAETRHPDDKFFPYWNGKLGFDFGIYRNLGVNVGLNLISGCGHGFGLSGEGGHGLALSVGFRF
jgi:hypothetical protein